MTNRYKKTIEKTFERFVKKPLVGFANQKQGRLWVGGFLLLLSLSALFMLYRLIFTSYNPKIPIISAPAGPLRVRPVVEEEPTEKLEVYKKIENPGADVADASDRVQQKAKPKNPDKSKRALRAVQLSWGGKVVPEKNKVKSVENLIEKLDGGR